MTKTNFGFLLRIIILAFSLTGLLAYIITGHPFYALICFLIGVVNIASYKEVGEQK